MQKFFELEELHPADREWTNRDGNGKGAGSLSVSGKFVWTLAADTDDDGTPNDKEGKEGGGKDEGNDKGKSKSNGNHNGRDNGGSGIEGGSGTKGSSGGYQLAAKSKAKASAVGPPRASVDKAEEASAPTGEDGRSGTFARVYSNGAREKKERGRREREGNNPATPRFYFFPLFSEG